MNGVMSFVGKHIVKVASISIHFLIVKSCAVNVITRHFNLADLLTSIRPLFIACIYGSKAFL